MKKKLIFLLPFLFFGCSNNFVMLKQPSIATQKTDAQNAWDELDGKKVRFNNQTNTNSTNSTQSTQNLSKVAVSMLQTSDTIPDWFYAPPKSDKYFYGAGEGNNVEESKISALNFIAGEINTAVSSSFVKSEGYSQNNLNTDFYKNVKTKTKSEVRKINFTNIEIMQTVKVNNKIYLLVRVDKHKLFTNLKMKFDLLHTKIVNQIKASKKYSLLEQLITLNKTEKDIKKALSLANILFTLNPSFDIKKYTNQYNSYLTQKIDILHKISFSVSGDKLFSQKLMEILNQEGYKISNNSDIKIKLKKQVRISKPYGMNVARVTVNIQVTAKNSILHSASIECKGISNTSSQAITKASIDFLQKLQKLSINKLLGFE